MTTRAGQHDGVAATVVRSAAVETVGRWAASGPRPVGVIPAQRGSASLRFEVLGSLRVFDGGRELPLGSGQQRVIAALLLLHGRRPYPRERLLAAVWGDAAPTYALNLMQKHVSALRKLLEPDRAPRQSSELLSWTDAGYLLRIPRGGLDLDDFRDLVARARAACASGDLVAAATSLHAADAVWRGSVCEGLANPMLDAERARLEEERITALEDRVEVDLQLGRTAEIVPELRRLIADNPLRERLRASLMHALYASGRPAEALGAYHDTRHLLLDELGMDPSAEVQRLHERILAADPTLLDSVAGSSPIAVETDAVATAAAHPEAADPEAADTGAADPSATPDPPASDPSPTRRIVALPAQLPHAIRDFSGRKRLIRSLDAALARAPDTAGSATVLAIVGSAGVGKTTLAVEWAHQIKHHFPDGQLYVNLRGFDPSDAVLDVGDAIRGFLDAFGLQPQQLPVTVAAQSALFRSLIDGRRMLILLDNARDTEQVQALLPGTSACLVIVTSRNAMTGLVATHGAVPLTVDVLNAREGRTLLERRLGADRLNRERQAVDEIVALCAGLPLALAIVAARVAMRPDFALDAITAELRDASGRLDALDGGDAATDVRRVLSWSYARLSDEAATLFRTLSLQAGRDIGIAAAARLSGRPPGATRRALTELARAHLVEEVSAGRFVFHDLLRAYAAELAAVTDSVEQRRDAVRRQLDFYIETSHRADRLLSPLRDPAPWPMPAADDSAPPLHTAADAMAWFQREHLVLVAAVAQADAQRLDLQAGQLAWNLVTYLDRGGHWHDACITQQIALDSARRRGDRRGEAHAARGLARGYTWRRQYADAEREYRNAFGLFEELADRTGMAQTHRSYGWALDRQGMYRLALNEFEAALPLFRAAGPEAGLAEALNAVGWFRTLLGDAEGALSLCAEALSLHQRIGHPEGEAHTWDSLGFVHHRLGRLAAAVECYTRSIEVWQGLADRYYEAATRVRLGDAQLAAGAVDQARRSWTAALSVLQDLGHPDERDVRRRLREHGSQRLL